MFILEEARVRVGLDPADTSQDQVLMATMNASLSFVETYLNRKLLYASQEERYYYTGGHSLQLTRFPVDVILSVERDSGVMIDARQFKVNRDAGTLLFKATTYDDEFIVKYTGGYRTLPSDLELVLWEVFDVFWPLAQPGGGGGGGSSTVSGGEISAITIPDVGTVRFATSGSSSGGGSASGALEELVGFTNHFYLLAPYRLSVV